METNNQPNRWKQAFLATLVITAIFLTFLWIISQIGNSYNKGRTQGQLDIINGTTQTGTILYLMNTSDAKSINSTSISKIQQDFLTSCIKAGVCTFNQTKYEELTGERYK